MIEFTRIQGKTAWGKCNSRSRDQEALDTSPLGKALGNPNHSLKRLGVHQINLRVTSGSGGIYIGQPRARGKVGNNISGKGIHGLRPSTLHVHSTHLGRSLKWSSSGDSGGDFGQDSGWTSREEFSVGRSLGRRLRGAASGDSGLLWPETPAGA